MIKINQRVDMLRMAAHGDFLREPMVDRSVIQEIRKKKLQGWLLKGQTQLSNKYISEVANQITSLGSAIRKQLLHGESQAQPSLRELDKLLQDLTHRIAFVGGEKTPLRPAKDVPEAVRMFCGIANFKRFLCPQC